MRNHEEPRVVLRRDIVREYWACPFCGWELNPPEETACCGEVGHEERVLMLKDGSTLYETQDSFVIEESEVVEPEDWRRS